MPILYNNYYFFRLRNGQKMMKNDIMAEAQDKEKKLIIQIVLPIKNGLRLIFPKFLI